MKLYKSICLISLLFSGISLFSQNQTITLKDGTVFEGYISEQDYTTGQGKISYSRMTKTFLSEDIQGKRTEKKEFRNLSKEWQDWAIENNKVETHEKNRFVSLTNMTVKGQPSRLLHPDQWSEISDSLYNLGRNRAMQNVRDSEHPETGT